VSRRFIAPGKAVVVGEYAVVDGAPAIVAAVDIGVDVRVTPSDTLTTTSAVGDTRYVDAALAAAQAPPGHYAFDLHRPPDLDDKPGLGGSAAATVVAIHAARTLQGEAEDPEAVWRLATRVHHTVQGSGSGIDVAASAFGGLRRFVREQPPVAMPIPPGLLRLVWSGASASTGPRVERYRAWAGRDRFVADSAALVEGFCTDPVGAMRDDRRLLEAMAASAGLSYRTPALDRIAHLADAVGGAAKPSGAGGGDVAVAWLPDDDADTAFRDACAAEGLAVLDASLDPVGVRED